MPGWVSQLERTLRLEPCVLVTLDKIVGSAPRESGARMIVTADAEYGSIGGGNLEFEATAHARELLGAGNPPCQEHRPYSLGPALNQCCGGTVTLLYGHFPKGVPGWLAALSARSGDSQPLVLASAIDEEAPFKVLIGPAGAEEELPEKIAPRARDMLDSAEAGGIEAVACDNGQWWLEIIGRRPRPLYLFGAGHVGQAVARLLRDLPFEVTWIDGRAGVFPDRPGPNITVIDSGDAVAGVQSAPPGCIFVVMTHSHQLDEDICFSVLSRDDFAWLGLIGSVTKRRRFVQRLAGRGIADAALERLVCPIGLPGIRGKQPATIALSLAAQLMHGRTRTVR